MRTQRYTTICKLRKNTSDKDSNQILSGTVLKYHSTRSKRSRSVVNNHNSSCSNLTIGWLGVRTAAKVGTCLIVLIAGMKSFVSGPNLVVALISLKALTHSSR